MALPSAPASQPVVLIVSHALSGHFMPLVRIASVLHARGWTVYFLGPSSHQARISASGAHFLAHSGDADLDDKLYFEQPPTETYNSLPWYERVLIDIRVQILEPLPTAWSDFCRALSHIHSQHPQSETVVICEAFFHGILPLKYGAPLPEGVKPPKTICVSITVPAIRSVDVPPFGYPGSFDPTPKGRERNARLWSRAEAKLAPLTQLLDSKMIEAGASRGTGEVFLSGSNYVQHDVILELGVPSFEFPRPDWPPNFKFAGIVQGVPKDEELKAKMQQAQGHLAWWGELVSNSAIAVGDPRRKKIVVVAQGTVEIDPNDLILPTIHGLADRDDILTVAILGWKDAKLPDGAKLPDNARIADYLSYDAVLVYADVWVHNAGFGAVNHGIAHGVPMVVAGEGMDKTENAKRVQWSEIGINLDSPKPTAEKVREGILTVLEDRKYLERTEALRAESEHLDCFNLVEQEIERLGAM